ncbi:hypothetical protein PUNSTDRAFT_44659 [Punctularia strigosozonata HHB-11173 SS5]|uniref:uncharacterized protein n=1 Tax=Punctularia strigosozonata (strain HHB-11173) TaxID=741275 RepID=UPI000441685E|nr:uncharacterized protein PUNSTDRAFT_44659 [Punctularia strigosozonata HHB-11173 SS5]EIN09275.1 hypothetical protein PUNSTDRAFT_44659 [Punctularia strigosozonata HHB-11173 SS5]
MWNAGAGHLISPASDHPVRVGTVSLIRKSKPAHSGVCPDAPEALRYAEDLGIVEDGECTLRRREQRIYARIRGPPGGNAKTCEMLYTAKLAKQIAKFVAK